MGNARQDSHHLVRRFLENRDVILGFILALTCDYDVAEEIFQEVSLSILEEATRGAQVVQFLPWAREISRHRVADYYRRKAKQAGKERPLDGLPEIVAQAFAENEDSLFHQARMKALLDCVQGLRGRSRDVIEGFYGERQSIRQLAARLSWQEGSVKVALVRARKALADCVEVRLRSEDASRLP